MTSDGNTHTLTLTRGQVAALLSYMSIAEAGIGAYDHGEWVPKRDADAKLLRGYIVGIQSVPTLERPMTELRTWLRKTSS